MRDVQYILFSSRNSLGGLGRSTACDKTREFSHFHSFSKCITATSPIADRDKHQESKQARKREALVNGTRGRREKETSQLCEQPIPCTAFGGEGIIRNGTELDSYHLP
jgi:hypothetical protein